MAQGPVVRLTTLEQRPPRTKLTVTVYLSIEDPAPTGNDLEELGEQVATALTSPRALAPDVHVHGAEVEPTAPGFVLTAKLRTLAVKLNLGTEPRQLTAEWYDAGCPPEDMIERARAEVRLGREL
jgi:hypothetical protein